MATVLQGISDEMANVATRVQQSLVHLQNGSRGIGTGTIWHPDGLIVTNAHVVRSRRLLVTLPDGWELPRRVLVHDSNLDLAALSVEADGLPTIMLGDSRRLRSGQLVMATGQLWSVPGAVPYGAVIGLGHDSREEAPPQRE